MAREEIEIEIRADGTVEYTIKGVKGSSCESISQLLEQLGSVQVEEKTSEFYELGDKAFISIGNG